MNKQIKLTLTAGLLFLFSVSFVYSWVYFENSALSTPTGNVTYIIPSGGLNATNYVEVDDPCINISGGIYNGSYCFTSSTPINITIGEEGILNINSYDEETLSLMTTESIVKIVNDDTSQVFDLNFTGSYSLDVPVGNYSVYYGAVGFVQREYYFENDAFDSFRLDLYFLNESESTLVTHTTYDENSNVIEDLLIKLQRYYPDTDSYQTVAMTKSNYEGKSILYTVLYDVFYKMVYVDNEGNILRTTSPSKFFETETSDLIILTEDPLESFRTYDTVSYSLDFFNQSNTTYARFIFSDTNNVVRTGCLRVDFVSPATGINNVYYECINSTSATLTYAINKSLEGEYKATGIIDTDTENSWYNLDIDYFDTTTEFEFAEEGVFIGAMFAGTVAMMGIATISGAVVFLMIGIIMMGAVGLIGGLGWTVIATFVTLGFIFIFILRRKG